MGGLLAAAAGLAHADFLFTVNTTADLVDINFSDVQCRTAANNCSLRAAIMQANHLSAAGVITIVVPDGVYVLGPPVGSDPNGDNGEASGGLNITTPLGPDQYLQIVGAGADRTFIDGNQTDRVIEFAAGRAARIEGLTLRNGHRGGINSFAGGLLNFAELTIANCIVENNRSESSGGGVISEGGSGIGARLHIIDSIIRNNQAAFSGGGLSLSGTNTIRGSTIHGNSAGINGGGIFAHATTYILNSTISSNVANTDGGGIYAALASTALYNVSVVNNDADHDRDQNGGIGGGVFIAATNGRFIAVNSLIASNTILDAPIDDDCNGPLEVYGWNLFGTTSGCSYTGNGTAARGLIALNSIGPLQDNGGPTPTHALLAGSAAIDSTFANTGCIDETGVVLGYDQRGAPRPAGMRCDVGAYEYGAIPPVYDRIFSSGFDVAP